MKKLKLLLTVVFVSVINVALMAQTVEITGAIRTMEDEPLPNANVVLRAVRDSSQATGTSADAYGNFSLSVKPGPYYVTVSFIGYEAHEQRVFATKDVKLGVVKLKVSENQLPAVELKERMVRTEVIGDTTQYNADAFKTNPDATAQDLLTKMPGVVVENGTVKAQGEEVKKVLVDGKEFFSDDPNIALQNLPAEIIDKVQVFDDQSDQSKFTGFNDGNTTKTLNIVTRSGKSNGEFGKVYGGYGSDDRYISGGNMNFFNGNQRISLIGLSNNINQQNFSSQDILGVVGNTSNRRRGGGGFRSRGGGSSPEDFMVGMQNGISQTHAIGLNFIDEWGDKLKLNGSYFFNQTDNVSNNTLTRSYFSSDADAQFYEEFDNTSSVNTNHRFNVRLEYDIDDRNSIILQPRLSLQQNSSNSSVLALTSIGGTELSDIQNLTNSNTEGYSFSNNLLFRHRFEKRGRTISLRFNTSLNDQEGVNDLYSSARYFTSVDSLELIDQRTNQLTEGRTFSGNLTYTEPLGRGMSKMLMLSYSPSHTLSTSDQSVFALDTVSDAYSLLDTSLTNVFESTYFTQTAGLGFMYRKNRDFNLMTRINFQYATLNGLQQYPTDLDITREFQNILPMVGMRLNISSTSNFRTFYRTSTNAPSISQLQNVIDNSNPLLLSTGDPDLEQEYSHFFVARYSLTIPKSEHSLFAVIRGETKQDYIANSTVLVRRDTTIADVDVAAGAQLNSPVNLDGYYNISSFLTYGLPLDKLKSNLNISAGLTYNRTPGLINGAENIASTRNFNGGFVLGSNISKYIDFTVSYTGNLNLVDNSLVPEENYDYFYHQAGVKLNYLTKSGLVFNTQLDQSFYNGLTDGFNQNFLLWNAGIGYKFMKDDAAELKISIFDILGQNQSISRFVTETYVEDSQTDVLQRYLMLSFTYTFRNFRAS